MTLGRRWAHDTAQRSRPERPQPMALRSASLRVQNLQKAVFRFVGAIECRADNSSGARQSTQSWSLTGLGFSISTPMGPATELATTRAPPECDMLKYMPSTSGLPAGVRRTQISWGRNSSCSARSARRVRCATRKRIRCWSDWKFDARACVGWSSQEMRAAIQDAVRSRGARHKRNDVDLSRRGTLDGMDRVQRIDLVTRWCESVT